MSGPELNATPAELLPSALSLNEARHRPSSYRPPSIYTRPDRQRARIAPLCRSPISSFTIFSTLPMASDEPFSGILPGWVARRALRIRARPLGASPTSLGPTEPVAAPSRRVVQQLAAPVQLDEEWRVGPHRYGRRRCRVVPRHQCLRWPRLPCLWVRLPCLRQRHAGRDRSRVRGERRVGGQLLRVRRHHRGEVEHGRPPPLGTMKATVEATIVHSGGFFAASSLPRTFVDPASVCRA